MKIFACSRALILFAAAALLGGASARAQLRVTGQADAAFLSSQDGYSQYVVNGGRATFAWRLDLFGDAVLSDNIVFLSNVRVMEDEVFRVNHLALRISDIASSGIGAEAGLIELPIGNLGERRFPRSNPFHSLPLTREHRTTFSTASYRVEPDVTLSGNGMPLLDRELYDAGISLNYSAGPVDLSFALVNGMVSATSSYSYRNGMNTTGGFGKIARAAITPFTGLTAGVSYGFGPILSPRSAGAYVKAVDPESAPQEIVEGDIDFSVGHVSFYGEGFLNTWKFQDLLGADLRAGGFSVEGKMAVTPRLSVAGRIGGLFFNTVSLLDIYGYPATAQRWDYDLLRYEAALGYRFERNLLVKVSYQWNVTHDVDPDPHDNLLGIETVLSF